MFIIAGPDSRSICINKLIWIKAALGIMTTDLKPKLAMEECEIGKKKIKIYGYMIIELPLINLERQCH